MRTNRVETGNTKHMAGSGAFVFFSADDFGGCMPASEKIAGYVKERLLQSVSIFGNCPNPADYVALLPPWHRIGIHLDLTEGKPLSDPARIPLLLGKGGRFNGSFFRLLALGILRPGEVYRQAYEEISAQIRNILEALPGDYAIRLDSHRHFHMIPCIFRAALQAAKDSGRQVEYIRFPAERTGVYLRTPAVWRYIRPVNLLKVLVLNLCGRFDRKTLKAAGLADQTALFCGVMFSGHMTEREIAPVYDRLLGLAKRKGSRVEFLFHPGYLAPGEEFPDPDNPFLDFYISKNRREEAQALRRLGR